MSDSIPVPGRVPASLRAIGRHLMTGLTLLGQANTMSWVVMAETADRELAARNQSNPDPQVALRSHPERIAPSIAPSKAELALWAPFG